MVWAVFSALGAFYLANVRLVAAFSLSASGFGVGVGAFSDAAALKMARRKKTTKKKKSKVNVKMIKRAAKAARLDYLSANGQLGLGDAAVTALACGALSALLRALGAVGGTRAAVKITPDFTKTRVSGEICGVLSAKIGKIAFEMIKPRRKMADI